MQQLDNRGRDTNGIVLILAREYQRKIRRLTCFQVFSEFGVLICCLSGSPTHFPKCSNSFSPSALLNDPFKSSSNRERPSRRGTDRRLRISTRWDRRDHRDKKQTHREGKNIPVIIHIQKNWPQAEFQQILRQLFTIILLQASSRDIDDIL